ncbi:MAG: hypothetical protein QOG53_1172 [Frankiales bacterium]|jgi:hypothetical protein|nr:hypothetical protein [Frankiales bacterium]
MNRASRLTVVVLVIAMLGAAAGSGLYFLVHDGGNAQPTKPTMPDVGGLTFEGAFAALTAAGLTNEHHVEFRSIANDDVPINRVAAQSPWAGTPAPEPGADIVLDISAGGPTITFAELPAKARALARTFARYDATERILVTTTAKGVAYKTDILLFGPCPAVDAAYRTYQDPRYDDTCY